MNIIMISLIISALSIPVGYTQATLDFSAEFKGLYDGDQKDDQIGDQKKEVKKILSEEDLKLLQEFKIFLIPGYFSNFTVKMTPIGYFKEAIDHLAQQGLKDKEDYERLIIGSQQPSYNNFDLLEESIKNSPKKVIILCHSKGCTDFLRFIIDNPELQEKIAGLITIQAPFRGTEVADSLINGSFTWYFFSFLLKMFGGTMESLKEFSTVESQKFMQENSQKIAQIKFPIINFSSSLAEGQEMTFPLLRQFHRLLKKENAALNDGLVPTESAYLPGCPRIHYQGLDHTDTVVTLGARGNRKKFLDGLLKIFIDNFLKLNL